MAQPEIPLRPPSRKSQDAVVVLVLRMIEGGTIMPDLTLDNLIGAIREVSHDITGRSRVRLAIL